MNDNTLYQEDLKINAIDERKKKNMSLKEKLIKNSTIELTSTLTESKVYTKKDMIQTPVPMINVALAGSIDGGITPGLTMLAGPSKHFKTGFALLLASAYLKKYPDGVILFYDSEFGTPQSYFNKFNIPLDSVVHTPIVDVEELKFDMMKQLKEITRDEKVLIIIDSIGNLASKKEVEDALNEKSVADMSRAKQLKSLFVRNLKFRLPLAMRVVLIGGVVFLSWPLKVVISQSQKWAGTQSLIGRLARCLERIIERVISWTVRNFG